MKNTQDINAEAVRSSALLAIATAALERISKCEDAPDIDAAGEWQTGLHCGVEDRDCQDRYQGADYGHTVGVEKGLGWASNEAKHALERIAQARLPDSAVPPSKKRKQTMSDQVSGDAGHTLPAAHGSALLRRLQNHRAMMSPEQKERHAGKLLLDATEEIDRLIGICTHVHDRMLRGDDDMTLMQKLQEGWQGPNGKLCDAREDGQ